MKSDEFIREVEDELRQDTMKQLWDRYGLLVIAVAFAIIAGTGGFVGWQAWQDRTAQAAARGYDQALERALAGDVATGEGAQILESYAETANSGFASIARLRAATINVEAGDSERARANLAAIANDAKADRILRDLAILAEASRELDTGNTGAAIDLLTPLTSGTGAFRLIAIELLAAANLEGGNLKVAREQLTRLKDDAFVEDQQRRRAEETLTAIGGAETGDAGGERE